MKKISILGLLLLFVISVSAQPIFNVGVKAGFNSSKITANINDFNSESILRMHVGAFARLGFNRVYLQPEAYFSAKGGELKNSSTKDIIAKFDFNNVDVPILVGVNVLKGDAANLHVMAGPVFSFVTSKDVSGESYLDPQYYKDNYFGYQYGAGVDVWNFFLDVRIEHGSNNLYTSPDLNSKNRTFLVTVGYKIL